MAKAAKAATVAAAVVARGGLSLVAVLLFVLHNAALARKVVLARPIDKVLGSIDLTISPDPAISAQGSRDLWASHFAKYRGPGDLPFVPTAAQLDAHDLIVNHNRRTLIMVNSDCDFAALMLETAANTWASGFGSHLVDVKFVIGDSAVDGACPGVNINKPTITGKPLAEYLLFLPNCQDTYPPVKKVLCMWTFARNRLLDHYDFIAKADADAYVVIPNLLIQVAKADPKAKIFGGGIGTGRDEPIPPFCMGPFYIISRKVLELMPRDLAARATEYANSDVTFSRAVERFAGTKCMSGLPQRLRWSFINRYWSFDNGDFVRYQFNEKQQQFLPFTHGLTSLHVNAVSLHPFKRPEDMIRFHRAVSRSRLPLYRFPSPHESTPLPKELSNQCVHNPSRQYEVSGMQFWECASHVPANIKVVAEAFVIHLPNRVGSLNRAQATAQALRKEGIQATLFAGIDGYRFLEEMDVSPRHQLPINEPEEEDARSANTEAFPVPLNKGELGLRESFRLLAYSILNNRTLLAKDQLFLFLEDAVTFSPDFGVKLTAMLRERRCGMFLSSNSGGALLLGASIWRNGDYPRISAFTGGWKMADKDLETTHMPCFNYNSGAYGTFAFVTDLRTLQLMLTWLNDPLYAHLPMSHVWQYISDVGAPVRVAYPFLAIPTLHNDRHAHRSIDTEERIRIHRWSFG